MADAPPRLTVWKLLETLFLKTQGDEVKQGVLRICIVLSASILPPGSRPTRARTNCLTTYAMTDPLKP